MWHKKTVAVIFPTYREKKSIRRSILEFDASTYVDELIVVDNNAEKGTEKEVKKTRAKLIKESTQGYGAAIRTGIKNTNADLLIIAEPDGTFDGKDIVKLLAYSDDFDMVFGTRTHISMIKKNSEMILLRRIFDYFWGRLINVLFLSERITDVGCTMRLTNRKGWNIIKDECMINGPLFGTKWQLVAAKNKVRFIEIPVNFRKRIGTSSVTNTLLKQAKWATLMFLLIWKVWIYAKLGKKIY